MTSGFYKCLSPHNFPLLVFHYLGLLPVGRNSEVPSDSTCSSVFSGDRQAQGMCLRYLLRGRRKGCRGVLFHTHFGKVGQSQGIKSRGVSRKRARKPIVPGPSGTKKRGTRGHESNLVLSWSGSRREGTWPCPCRRLSQGKLRA